MRYLRVIILGILVLMFLGIAFLQNDFLVLLVPFLGIGSAVVLVGVCGYKFVKALAGKENKREAKLKRSIIFGGCLLLSVVYFAWVCYLILLAIAFSHCEGSCFTF